jgi:oxygen-independent coproporphyrinogen-3 oxidase
VPVESVYGEVLDKHMKNGLLTVDDTIRLTEKGLDVSNYVMADFLLS